MSRDREANLVVALEAASERAKQEREKVLEWLSKPPGKDGGALRATSRDSAAKLLGVQLGMGEREPGESG